MDVLSPLVSRDAITAQTSNLSLSASQSGRVYTNNGASGLVTFTLPGAAAGLIFEFVVLDSNGIRVVAAAGDFIIVGSSVSASGGRTDSTTNFSSVRLRALDDARWVACASNNPAAWAVT